MGDPSAGRGGERGRLVVFEGIDGSGKSSQVGRMAEWLRAEGRRVVTCRDPGATAAGDAIRQILLHRREIDLSARTEMLLYMAARAQLVAEVIRPALEAGAWVLSDRFLLSNIVYQGHAGGVDAEAIRRVGAVATDGVVPDLVLLLDIDPATAAARLDRPLDRLESRGDDYKRRVRDGYLREAMDPTGRVVVIDADADPDTVAARLRAAVEARFG